MQTSTEVILDETLLLEAKQLLKDKFDFLLSCYLEDMQIHIRAMESATVTRNVDSIILCSHTIKSSSRRMGALRLSALAADIEAAARTGGADARIISNIREMAVVFEETGKQLLLRQSGKSLKRS